MRNSVSDASGIKIGSDRPRQAWMASDFFVNLTGMPPRAPRKTTQNAGDSPEIESLSSNGVKVSNAILTQKPVLKAALARSKGVAFEDLSWLQEAWDAQVK